MGFGTKSLIAGAVAVLPAIAGIAIAFFVRPPEGFFMVIGLFFLIGAPMALIYAIASIVQCGRGKEDSILPAIGGILLALSPLALILFYMMGMFGTCGPPESRGGSIRPSQYARA